MDINNRRHLHAVAKDRLENSSAAAKIAMIYGGLVVGTTFLTSTVSFLLGHQISNYGGLSNLGMRSILSTFQSLLPILTQLFLLGLGLGFVNGMLRTSRRQFTSPQSLRMGFERFWPLMKVTLLQSGLYLLAMFASFQISSILFTFTPMAHRLTEALNTVMAGSQSVSPAELLSNPGFMAAIAQVQIPLVLLVVTIFLAIALPIFYHYRLVNYIIIDQPGIPALLAMRESRMLMRKNCLSMFKVDFSMWWYYLASILAMVLSNGDLILSLLGVELPFSGTVSYFLFMVIYLLTNFALICFLRPHVEVVYALAYDALKPEPAPASGGAVLGNIFNM